jgi:hypothetical protein
MVSNTIDNDIRWRAWALSAIVNYQIRRSSNFPACSRSDGMILQPHMSWPKLERQSKLECIQSAFKWYACVNRHCKSSMQSIRKRKHKSDKEGRHHTSYIHFTFSYRCRGLLCVILVSKVIVLKLNIQNLTLYHEDLAQWFCAYLSTPHPWDRFRCCNFFYLLHNVALPIFFGLLKSPKNISNTTISPMKLKFS